VKRAHKISITPWFSGWSHVFRCLSCSEHSLSIQKTKTTTSMSYVATPLYKSAQFHSQTSMSNVWCSKQLHEIPENHL